MTNAYDFILTFHSNFSLNRFWDKAWYIWKFTLQLPLTRLHNHWKLESFDYRLVKTASSQAFLLKLGYSTTWQTDGQTAKMSEPRRQRGHWPPQCWNRGGES